MRPVFDLEVRKLARAPVARAATVAVLLLVAATTIGGYAAAMHASDTDIGRKAADLAPTPGWEGFTGLAATSAGVTMLLATGIVMAWSVGREFTDGTVVGLFAAPPSPGAIALGKIAVVSAWSISLALAQALVVATGGVALGLPVDGVLRAAAVVTVASGALGVSALPVMWVATRWRGYLAGIAATLAIVVVTNLAAGFGLGALLPWAVPILWAMPEASLHPALLALPTSVGLLGAVATWNAWRELQLGAA